MARRQTVPSVTVNDGASTLLLERDTAEAGATFAVIYDVTDSGEA